MLRSIGHARMPARLRRGKAHMNRIVIFVAGAAVAVASLVAMAAFTGWPDWRRPDREQPVPARSADDARSHGDGTPRITLSRQQIDDAGITLAEARGGRLRRH